MGLLDLIQQNKGILIILAVLIVLTIIFITVGVMMKKQKDAELAAIGAKTK